MQYIKNFFVRIFYKPSIKLSLDKKHRVKLTITNSDKIQTLNMLYSAVRQISRVMGMDSPRQLINYLDKMDRGLIRHQKQEERKVKYKK